MLSPSIAQPANDSAALEHAIMHDIVYIDDLDEFLTDEAEDEVLAMLGNAGHLY